MSKKALKQNNKVLENAVLERLLKAACERYGTTEQAVRNEYGPHTPPSEKVRYARGYYVCLVRSFRVPLAEAARSLGVSPQLAYSFQVYYQTNEGVIESTEALKLIANDKA